MFPIFNFGSKEQKDKWLPLLRDGEAIGCFGLTEPQGGSDPASMLTFAEKKNGGYVINGAKIWITNASIANIAVVWAKTERKEGGGDIRGFLVEKGAKGFSAEKTSGKLSMRASDTGQLVFCDCWVPESAVLPGTDIGIKAAYKCLSEARYGIAWGVIGAAEACYEEVLNFAQSRMTFGKQIIERPQIWLEFLEMAERIIRMKLLALKIAELKQEEKLQFQETCLAKKNNVSDALWIARKAREILGAGGITLEHVSMRHACNLESVITYEGAEKVLEAILAECFFGLTIFRVF